MRKLTTLTGKNLPKLSVAKPGWPEADRVINQLIDHMLEGEVAKVLPNQPYLTSFDPETGRISITPQAVSDFTRVCDDMGLKLRDEK